MSREPRRLNLSLFDIFTSQLELLREKYALEWAALKAAAENVIARYETICAPVGEQSPVAIGSELAEKLRIGAVDQDPARGSARGRASGRGAHACQRPRARRPRARLAPDG